MQIETVEAMHFHRFSVVFSLSQSELWPQHLFQMMSMVPKIRFFSCIFSIENW